MSRPPMQEPPEQDARLLDAAGMERIEPSEVYNCLRWRTATARAGLLYASHLPIPWGCYWTTPARKTHVVWTCNLHTAVEVLSLVWKL